jgi:ABC-type multidrug transport system fused ATPase/permease subunit
MPKADPNPKAANPKAKDAFWLFARRMLRYYWLLAAAFVMVVLSSLTLVAGILGSSPILDSLIGEGHHKDLQELAADFNAHNLNSKFEFIQHIQVPQATIDHLPTGAYTALSLIMGVLAVVTIIGSVANFLHGFLSLTIVNRTVTNIRREAFFTALRAPLRTIVQGGTSDAISRIVNDTTQLANGLTMLLSKALLQVFKGVAGLVAALYFNPYVTVGALLVAPALYTVIRKLGKRIKRASNKALQSQADLYAAASESLQAMRVVKVYTTEVYEGGRFHRINKQVMRELNRVRTARALASPLTEMLSIFLLCAMTLGVGWIIIKGINFNGTPIKVSASDFIYTIISLAVAGASLKPLTGIINDIQAAAPAADRLRELLAKKPEPGHGFKLPRLARHKESIEFKGVTLTYANAPRPAIDNLTLNVAHGKRIAFVGPNGCGKTSLLSLVPRLFDPDQGAVLIDGHDIRHLSVRSVRSQIGMVTQETIIFKGTIRSNIAYGSVGSNDDCIVAAAKKARAHDFISAMPQGYDTPVAEQGLSLSGGQRQRIAIARAILRDPAILILDEATSMVDAESEAQIAAAITDFAASRTCLIVAHRLATVLNCDSIVVMDAGKIVDQGTHEELLGRCELYRNLAQHQFPG